MSVNNTSGTGQDNTATVQTPAAVPAPAAEAPVAPPAAAIQQLATETPAPAAPKPAQPTEYPSMLAGKQGKEGAEGDPAAPSETEFEIKLPDGAVADPEAVGFLKGMVKDGTMSAEAAQKAAEAHLAAIERFEATRHAEALNIVKGWEQEIREHPEFGGVNLERNVENAKLMLERYGSPKLVSDFQKMGVLSHPEFAFMLMRMHGDVSEGVSIGGAAETSPQKSTAEILFPNLQ